MKKFFTGPRGDFLEKEKISEFSKVQQFSRNEKIF